MIVKLIFQPPFPSNGDPQADAIIGIGYMYALLIIMFVFSIAMVYCYKKVRHPLPIIVIYLNTVWMTFGTMGSPYFPFTPNYQVFILLFNTAFFLLFALEWYNDSKNSKKN